MTQMKPSLTAGLFLNGRKALRTCNASTMLDAADAREAADLTFNEASPADDKSRPSVQGLARHQQRNGRDMQEESDFFADATTRGKRARQSIGSTDDRWRPAAAVVVIGPEGTDASVTGDTVHGQPKMQESTGIRPAGGNRGASRDQSRQYSATPISWSSSQRSSLARRPSMMVSASNVGQAPERRQSLGLELGTPEGEKRQPRRGPSGHEAARRPAYTNASTQTVEYLDKGVMVSPRLATQRSNLKLDVALQTCEAGPEEEPCSRAESSERLTATQRAVDSGELESQPAGPRRPRWGAEEGQVDFERANPDVEAPAGDASGRALEDGDGQKGGRHDGVHARDPTSELGHFDFAGNIPHVRPFAEGPGIIPEQTRQEWAWPEPERKLGKLPQATLEAQSRPWTLDWCRGSRPGGSRADGYADEGRAETMQEFIARIEREVLGRPDSPRAKQAGGGAFGGGFVDGQQLRGGEACFVEHANMAGGEAEAWTPAMHHEAQGSLPLASSRPTPRWATASPLRQGPRAAEQQLAGDMAGFWRRKHFL